jgi:hypothetical protein
MKNARKMMKIENNKIKIGRKLWDVCPGCHLMVAEHDPERMPIGKEVYHFRCWNRINNNHRI